MHGEIVNDRYEEGNKSILSTVKLRKIIFAVNTKTREYKVHYRTRSI